MLNNNDYQIDFNESITFMLDEEFIRDSIINDQAIIANLSNENIIELNKIFYLNDKNEIYNEYILPENKKILGKLDKTHLIIQEKDTNNNIKNKIFNLDNKTEIVFGNLLTKIKNDWNFMLIGENSDNRKIYFAFIDPNFNLVEFSFAPINQNIQIVGLLKAKETSLYNNKVLKIILLKRTIIIINNNGKLYKTNY